MKPRQASKGFDLNSLLQVIIFAILIATWYTFRVNGPNEYVNLTTVILGTVMALQVWVFLVIEKTRRDPFVMVLCFQMTFYYIFRVFSLCLYHYSVEFLRFPFTADNLNYSIAFMIAANFALYGGLYLNKVNYAPPDLRLVPRKPYQVLFLLGTAYVLSFAARFGIQAMDIISTVSSWFLNIALLMYLVVVYLLIYYRSLSGFYRSTLLGGVLLYIVIATMTGSRAGILTIGYYVLLGALVVFNHIKVKNSYLLVIMILLPVMIFLFTLTTYLRPRVEDRTTISKETIEVIKEFNFSETAVDMEVVLSPVFDRIAFLDFAAETISNSEQYRSIFNPVYYAKSIVDNVVTPGFDVFDTPRASNGLRFIYNKDGKPQKSLAEEGYQSDEFTLYGEAYALLGKWFSLIPLFLIGFFFKRMYVKVRGAGSFRAYAKKAIILYLFFSLFNSFGFDWLLFDATCIVITYLLFISLFKFRKITAPDTTVPES